MARLSPAEVLGRLDAIYGPCTLCEQRCGAMRRDGERGACGLDDTVTVYNRVMHMGEEAPLVPSYAIFLSGCSMACSFCSEAPHLLPPFGEPTDPGILAMKVAVALMDSPVEARNINFVGGEPSIALPFIARFAQALEALIDPPPILLNTNGYLTPEALALSTHLCPQVVADLKFGNDRCAQSVAGVADYTAVLHRNLALWHDGLADGRLGASVLPVTLWVRHLLMPGHLACCTAPALEWLSEHLPRAQVNVMPAFHPFGLADNAPWRSLHKEEREAGRDMLDRSGIALAWFDGRRHRPE